MAAAAAALGGVAALRGVGSQEIIAAGARMEPGQSPAPGQRPLSMHISDFAYRTVDDRRADRLRMEWHRDVRYHVVAVSLAESARPLRLSIDAATGLPSKIDTHRSAPVTMTDIAPGFVT